MGELYEQGDAGWPLMIRNKESDSQWTLAGIVSGDTFLIINSFKRRTILGGTEDGSFKGPVIAVNVYRNTDWIRDTIVKNGGGDYCDTPL